jgi:hypothetical protein
MDTRRRGEEKEEIERRKRKGRDGVRGRKRREIIKL